MSKLALLGAAAPVFTQRADFPYGLQKSDVDGIIDQCYKDRGKLLENFGEIFFYDTEALSPKLRDWFHGLGMEALPHATVMSAIQLRDADLRSELDKINVPTAILHGVADKICPFSFAEVMQKGIKNSKMIRFEKSGHGLFWDEQEKFNKELMSFIG